MTKLDHFVEKKFQMQSEKIVGPRDPQMKPQGARSSATNVD